MTTTDKVSWRQRGKAHIQGLSSVYSLAATLSAANQHSDLYKPFCWAQDLRASLAARTQHRSYSLASLLAQCGSLNSKNVSTNFFVMVSQIQLVAACQKYVDKLSYFGSVTHIQHHYSTSLRLENNHPTVMDVYNQEIEPLKLETRIPGRCTFLEWHADGCKYAALAGGGMVYLLLLIAGLGTWVRFRLHQQTIPPLYRAAQICT